MNVLEISQIIFNLTVSIAIIVVGVFFSIIAFDIIKAIKNIKNFAQVVKKESADFHRHVNGFLEAMATIPFITKFFSKKKSRSK